jgi:ribosome-binding factor A
MSAIRQEKIGRLLQKDLGEIFQQEGKNFGIGAMVSVTVVRVSQDLGSARIYLSIFPDNGREVVLKKVKEVYPQIRAKLAQRVKNQLRKVPELHFYIDDSYDYAQQIDILLKK